MTKCLTDSANDRMKLMTIYLCDDIRVKVRRLVVRDVRNISFFVSRIESATDYNVWEWTWSVREVIVGLWARR